MGLFYHLPLTLIHLYTHISYINQPNKREKGRGRRGKKEEEEKEEKRRRNLKKLTFGSHFRSLESLREKGKNSTFRFVLSICFVFGLGDSHESENDPYW